ncbi:MAG: UPF0147 family protein [Candidatus Woesearchaeota archaeon]|jgi:uncharacterized protein (UPF0147 family)|nr:UPF0147 family protein [Candidatus Woesearchaeota archaeon]
MSSENIDQIKEVIKTLTELSEEASVPKNVKLKLQELANTLNDSTDISMKVNQALNVLDEIANDINIEPYTRTQIWSIVSQLEKTV